MYGRVDDFSWTKPYVDNSLVVVVRKVSGITQLTDLADKVVAVQADSSALAALTGEDASEENKTLCASFKDLQQVGDYNSAFMNLESGAVDAICMDIGVANYEIESRGDKFMMLEDRLSSEEYGIGFKLGNTERHYLCCRIRRGIPAIWIYERSRRVRRLRSGSGTGSM